MDTQAITDYLWTAVFIALAIFVPKLRKPICWLFAIIFLVVIAARLSH
jgi:hypothetical protein